MKGRPSSSGAVFLAIFIVLLGLAPFSSERPDALQKALGLPGGEGSVWKALGGSAAALAGTWLILKALTRLRDKRF